MPLDPTDLDAFDDDPDDDDELDAAHFGFDRSGPGLGSPPTTRLSRWAPACPHGHPQRPVPGFAYRDKGGGLVQIRVSVRRNQNICSVVVQEGIQLVLVRVILCCPGGNWDDCSKPLNCGAKAFLDDDLDGRWVIDVESGESLPPWEPGW
jgi:hypothetical protein